MDSKVYNGYIAILKHELVPAMGCTEPIAVAFAAAKARDVLGRFPEHITAYLSGNIIKNVKGVTVPNSGGQRGIDVAATLGCVAGDASLELEVIKNATQEQIDRTTALVGEGFCDAQLVEGKDNLYIRIVATAGEDSASVTVEHEHTNITRIEKNGKVLLAKEEEQSAADDAAVDKSLLNVRDIVEFANAVRLEDVKPMLERQIAMNTAISQEGLTGKYGAAVG